MAGDNGQLHERPLRFAVLGPVRVWRGDEALSTGSPQQRALLAALLLRGGRTATAAELVDGLWGDDPPDAAIATLRTYASRLRRAFGPDAEILVSESGGYAIRAGADALDAARAERLATEAERAHHRGDRARAHGLIIEALALWDGQPLIGVPGPFAETQRVRLEERRLSFLETRLDLDLALGHHAEAVSELTGLTAAHPLRERLRELLMLALYRGGRQAEALAVYADTRRLLAEELGVDPRPELSELHSRIRRADPGLTPLSGADERSAAPTLLRPAQLPLITPEFTMRATFATQLREQLTCGSVMAVSAVAGIGGVGKTTLAVYVAHHTRHHFPDGQLYVDLQGTDADPTEPEAVLGAFLRALGIPDTAVPEGLDERAALYRSTLDGRRVLTLLDNARDAAQVRPLLPGTEGCAALITSRTRMVDLEGAHLLDLDVMSPDEGLLLFTRIVGKERVEAEPKAATDVVAACGFLPLALRIAASRLASRTGWTVATLARELADERRRLTELRAGDLAVEATFELGYGQLHPEQARAFRLLGIVEGPDISATAAAALLDLDPYDAEELIETLVDTSLLESPAPGRYRFHDLVRLYARDRAERDQPAADRHAALARLMDFYLATAARVYALERPGDRTVDHLAPTGHPGLAFPGQDAALDWLFAEADGLIACARQCVGNSLRGRAADLLMATLDLAESGTNSRQYEVTARAIGEAAGAAGDTRTEARARFSLGHLYHSTGRFDQAEQEMRRALELGTVAGDPMLASRVPNQRGIIACYQGHFARAEDHLVQALDAFRADANEPGEASALSNLARLHLDTGRTRAGVELAEQALSMYQRLGAPLRLANGMYVLGIALTRTGRTDEALSRLTHALRIFGENRQPLWEGMTHFRLAETHLAAERPAPAAEHAERALALGGLGGEGRRAAFLTLLGKALTAMRQRDRARECWREARTIYERLGSSEVDEVDRLMAAGGTPGNDRSDVILGQG
ncbi:BTAD domain-containing putative transcriptional regulator [Streptomyces cucumeris]|uniref:AfsR/SARP family transcriptional regulator n=1 Tax=Streptomyces cucumeris TaxID=2962890 RepID=UPI003D75ED86